MPSSTSEGRRAAQASAAPMDNDQEERNQCLRKVQARDLVEFGMIPVSSCSNNINYCLESFNSFHLFFCTHRNLLDVFRY